MFGYSDTLWTQTAQEHSGATQHSQSSNMAPEHLCLHMHTCNCHRQSHTLAEFQTYKDTYSTKSHATTQPTRRPHSTPCQISRAPLFPLSLTPRVPSYHFTGYQEASVTSSAIPLPPRSGSQPPSPGRINFPKRHSAGSLEKLKAGRKARANGWATNGS